MPTLPSHTYLRFLTEKDADAYQKLRLESLKLSPTAFLTTYDVESHLDKELFANHLQNAYHPPYFGFVGIFVHEKLVGYGQVYENTLVKQRHTTAIYNVYISPAYRQQGLATYLFEHIFDLLKNNGGIERLFLTCTASNTVACDFYEQLGFEQYGIKHQAIKWNDVYDDEIEWVKVL
jgi:ribosomal protein S18 acetylase RimI-like enzyme